MTITAGESTGVAASSSRRHRATTSSSVVAERMAATGVAGSRPPAISSAAIVAALRHAHQHDHRSSDPRQRSPVDIGFAGSAVTGDDGDRGGDAAVGHGNTGGGRRGEGRRDAGNHLERDAGLEQGEGLLATAAEHERVTALQPHDPLAGPGQLDEQRRDQLLRHRASGSLADVDQLGLRGDEVEHT